MVFINKAELKKIAVSSLGLENLSSEYQDEIIAGLEQNISMQLQLSVFKQLTEDDRKEFEAISALSVGDEARKFLESKIPNFDKFIASVAKQTVEEFKNLRDTPVDVVPDEAYEIGNPDL